MLDHIRPHRRWQQLADSVADGSAAPRERTSFERHQAQCSRCAEQLAATQQLRAALHALPDTAAPRSFRIDPGMLAASAAREPAPVRPAPRFALRAAQAMTGVAALALGGLLAADVVGTSEQGDAQITAAQVTDSAYASGGGVSESAAGAAALGEAATTVAKGAAGETPVATPVPPITGGGVTPIATPVAPRTGPGDAAATTPADVSAAAAPGETVASAYAAGAPTSGAHEYVPATTPAAESARAQDTASGSGIVPAAPDSAIGGREGIGMTPDGDGNDNEGALRWAQVAAAVVLAGAGTAWIALKQQPRRPQ